jgi:hypothetical protein
MRNILEKKKLKMIFFKWIMKMLQKNIVHQCFWKLLLLLKHYSQEHDFLM